LFIIPSKNFWTAVVITIAGAYHPSGMSIDFSSIASLYESHFSPDHLIYVSVHGIDIFVNRDSGLYTIGVIAITADDH